MLLQQAEPGMTELLDVMGRIATAQVVMAVVVVVMGVLALAAAVIVLFEFRNLRILLRGLRKTVEILEDRIAPLIDRANIITADVAGMTDRSRRKVDDLLFTLEQINRSIQSGSEAAQERVRRFSAVIDVVQTEAEELLLDAAATARGVHETARLLHEPPPRRTRVVQSVVQESVVQETVTVRVEVPAVEIPREVPQ